MSTPRTISGLIVAFTKQPNPYSSTPPHVYRITVRDDVGATWTGTPAIEFGAATGRRLTGYKVQFCAKVVVNRGYGKYAFKYPYAGKITGWPA